MPKQDRVHKTHDHSTNNQKELSSDEAERMANAAQPLPLISPTRGQD